MISDAHACIFVEVPKTASTSVRALLGAPDAPHLDLWQIKTQMESARGNGRRARRGGTTGAGRGRLFRRGLRWAPWGSLGGAERTLAAPTFEGYFKFGFVRNPWDRTVSLYNRHEGNPVGARMTFDEFVEWIRFSSATCVHPSPHRYQLDWFVDPNGEVLADFIGRFEHLERDWAHVCDCIGLRCPLPHRNRNPDNARHYAEYYTPRTRDVIARKFAVDIEYFGYEFGA